jgi:hypothetical protein
MSNAILESLDKIISETENYLAKLKASRKVLVLVDQCSARLASLNEDLARKQDAFDEGVNTIRQRLFVGDAA